MKKIMLLLCIGIQTAHARNAEDSLNTRIAKIDGNLYFIDCVNGFGGGNVTHPSAKTAFYWQMICMR
jgi:hypothetical protein